MGSQSPDTTLKPEVFLIYNTGVTVSTLKIDLLCLETEHSIWHIQSPPLDTGC